jgi:hypothetical protein
MWRVLNWAVDHQLHTTAALNERVARGGRKQPMRTMWQQQPNYWQHTAARSGWC